MRLRSACHRNGGANLSSASAVISLDFFQHNLRLLRAFSSAQPLAPLSVICPVSKRGKGGLESADYDLARRERHLSRIGGNRRAAISTAYCEVARGIKVLAEHRARPHSARDLRDFLLLREGENSAAAMREGPRVRFSYDKNRYTRHRRNERQLFPRALGQ